MIVIKFDQNDFSQGSVNNVSVTLTNTVGLDGWTLTATQEPKKSSSKPYRDQPLNLI